MGFGFVPSWQWHGDWQEDAMENLREEVYNHSMLTIEDSYRDLADEDEEEIPAYVFDLFEEGSRWTFPQGNQGFKSQMLVADEMDTNNLDVTDILVIVFSSVDQFEFGKSFRHMMNVSTQTKIQLLQVRDELGAWYHRDSGDGVDPFFEATVFVKEEIECFSVKPQRVATLGFCCGGYAAIRIGMSIGASHILAFSPQVFINPDERRLRHFPLVYFDSILESFQEAENCPLESLVRVFEMRNHVKNLPTSIEIHIGADAKADVLEMFSFVDELKELNSKSKSAGNFSLCIHVHHGCGHAVPAFLKSQGKLQDTLWNHLCVNIKTGITDNKLKYQ